MKQALYTGFSLYCNNLGVQKAIFRE